MVVVVLTPEGRAAWRRHGVTHDRVIARNSYIAEGSTKLWEYAQAMIEQTVAAGHLAAAPLA